MWGKFQEHIVSRRNHTNTIALLYVLLVVRLKSNVVMMRAAVRIMQSFARRGH